MTPAMRSMSRVKLLTALIAIAAPIWVAGQTSNFMGGTPASVDATKVRTTRLRFPKGSRSNWHSHTWGQLLMLEEGHGRTQVRAVCLAGFARVSSSSSGKSQSARAPFSSGDSCVLPGLNGDGPGQRRFGYERWSPSEQVNACEACY